MPPYSGRDISPQPTRTSLLSYMGPYDTVETIDRWSLMYPSYMIIHGTTSMLPYPHFPDKAY